MMMTSMKRKIAATMAAVTLMTIGTAALADNGDAARDKNAEPRYKVGSEVEVYESIFHVATRRCKILQADKNEKGEWEYIVDPVKGRGRLNSVTADEIESN